MEERIILDRQAQANIDAYIAYTHGGGEQRYGKFDAKNAKLFEQAQLEAQQTRAYTNWRNEAGKDCKAIGPATKCACDHRYKDHDYLHPKSGAIACLTAKCPCKSFSYIPVHGSYDFKCLCKHSYRTHSGGLGACSRCKCDALKSAFSCSCGERFGQHQTVVESREERMNAGRFVSEAEGVLLEARGFTGLVEYAESFAAKVDTHNNARAEVAREDESGAVQANLLELAHRAHRYT